MRPKKLKDVSTVLSEALALSLADRVKLRDEIMLSINREVREKKEEAAQAEQIANGKPNPSS